MSAVPGLKWSAITRDWESSETPFGSYNVERRASGFLWRYCFDEHYDEGQFDCDSFEDGKAAAQKDWTERTGEMFAEAVAPLLTALRTIGNYLDEGQLVTARAMVLDLLKKHGGGQ